MSEKEQKRMIAAAIMRDIRRKRAAARKKRGRAMKSNEDLFEQLKVKMVMRIYGVSSEQAKEIIADRMAERAALEAENEAKREKRARNLRRRVRDEDDDAWIPMEDIIGMEVGESDD